MAELFLAKDVDGDRLVVLKRILPYLADEVEFVRMFLDEARIAASLHHANVVEVFELGRLEGSTFIAMEWVDGFDLRKMLAREQERGGVVPPGIAAWLVARLCEGLHYAHFRKGPDGKPLGIIHRDVSPQNVMVSFNADVKLVDFGIAKATAWVSHSKPGVIKGKFLYLAPEQLGEQRLDHRADLFALGTMLYEITTGKSPFYRSSTEAVIYAIKLEDAAAPHTVRAGYPRMLSKVVMKCLQRDRDVRFQTADEVRAALEDFMRVEAPTTRADVVKYVAGLFGSDEDRTSIYIPPNAQSSLPPSARPTEPPVPPVTRSVPPPTAPIDAPSAGFADIVDERTAPIAVNPARALVPEGRRATGETQSISGVSEPTAVTEPNPPRGRDAARTAVLDDAAAPPQAPPDEEEATAITLGATARRAPLVGGPAAPPAPSPRPARRDWDEASDVSLQPLEPDLVRRPGPPVPSDEIPVIGDDAILSVGEAEPFADELLLQEAERVRHAPRAEGRRPPPPVPTPPVRRDGAQQRSPRRSRQTALPRRPEAKPQRAAQPRRAPAGRQRVGDPEDLIDTTDMANSAAFDEPSGLDWLRELWSHHWRVVVVGAAALLGLMVLTWVLWPAPRGAQGSTAARRLADAEPIRREVRFEAPKGAAIAIDGVAIAPGEVRLVTGGRLSIDYRCPATKKRTPPEARLVVDIVAGEGPQHITIPCR